LPRANVALFLGLAISGLALDLLTKAWVFRLLGPPGARDTWWLWDGYVGLQTAYNAGGLFGMFQGAVHWLAGFSVVAALAVLYWFFLKGAAFDRWLSVTLGCILAGILGNLYDRLGLWSDPPMYAVRDWILLSYQGHHWPNFNIADSLLVCGTGLLVWHTMRADPPRSDSPEDPRPE